MLRAVATSKVSGWVVAASIPIAVAEAPLKQTLTQWFIGAFCTLLLTVGAAWWFGRALERPMRAASEAAAALGHGAPLQPLDSPVIEADRIVAALKVAETELRERSEHQRLLLGELSHRVKNVLAVVQALVLRSLSEQRPVTEAREVISKRLHALARAHELLTATNWRGASLRDLVAAELAPYAARAQIEGPQIIVQAGMAQMLAILVHELNQCRQAWRAVTRRWAVLVRWTVSGSGSETKFTFLWKEMGGPVVSAPSRKGFGSTLLEGAILADKNIRPRMAFDADGFVYELNAPLHAISDL